MAKKATDVDETYAITSVEAEAFATGQPTAAELAPVHKETEKTGANKSGFYIYIGPNIKGLIQNGTTYRGNRANAYQMAAAAIEQQPKVKSLIVSGDALPEARLKIKVPGNVLYANYKELAGK